MTRRLTAMAVATALLLLSGAVDAQWLKYPTPGIPRLPDGRANLSAPAPRTADGKPDISGLWRASVNYISDLTRGAKPGDVVMLPAAEALVRERRANFSRDERELQSWRRAAIGFRDCAQEVTTGRPTAKISQQRTAHRPDLEPA